MQTIFKSTGSSVFRLFVVLVSLVLMFTAAPQSVSAAPVTTWDVIYDGFPVPTSGIAVDGAVFVTGAVAGQYSRVLKYDTTGLLLTGWDVTYDGFPVPTTGITASGGLVFVSASLNTQMSCVFEYDADGVPVTSWDVTYDDFVVPTTGISASSGFIYVTGSVTNQVSRVFKYDARGALVTSWDVAIDDTLVPTTGVTATVDNVYVTASLLNQVSCVFKYDTSGQLVTSWDVTYDGFMVPTCDIAADGHIYVAGALSNQFSRILEYDTEGVFINSWEVACDDCIVPMISLDVAGSLLYVAGAISNLASMVVVQDTGSAGRLVIFAYTPPSVTVTAPNGGESWLAGTPHAITWTPVNITGNVKIVLLKNGAPALTIKDACNASAGSFAWTIPASLAAGSNYAVKVASTTNQPVTDSSDASFSITQPVATTVPPTTTITPPPVVTASITVTSPNGGELWKTGSRAVITWQSARITGKMKIELLKNGVLVKTLTSSASAATGSYTWSVPRSQAVGSSYTIRVTSVSKRDVRDVSDGCFTISR